MEQNQKNRRNILAVFAIFFGIWILLAYLCFPPPACFVAWIAGLLCGGGGCYLLYTRQLGKTSAAVSTEIPQASPELYPASSYPCPLFLLVMAVVEGRDPTEGDESPDAQLAGRIGRRLTEAVTLPDFFVTTALQKQYVVCYINYKRPLIEAQEQLCQVKACLEDAHKALIDLDGISATFLLSDVDLTVNELQDGIQQVSDLDWYMHIFSYQPTHPVVSLEHIQMHVLASEETAASFQSRNMLQLKKQFIGCFLDKNYVSAKRLINEIMTRSMMESYTRPLRTYRVAFENIKGLIMDATEAVRLQLDVAFFSSIFPEHGVNEVTSMPELQARSNYILDQLIEYEQEKRRKEIPEHYVQICTYVDDHIYDPAMNISTIALALGMNASFVSRVFKEYKGMTLLDYIHFRRVTRAKDLLRDGKSIAEVTEITGFGSIRTFSRAFQKVEGTSPGVYKQEVAESQRPS